MGEDCATCSMDCGNCEPVPDVGVEPDIGVDAPIDMAVMPDIVDPDVGEGEAEAEAEGEAEAEAESEGEGDSGCGCQIGAAPPRR
jgi:hypothetical protein